MVLVKINFRQSEITSIALEKKCNFIAVGDSKGSIRILNCLKKFYSAETIGAHNSEISKVFTFDSKILSCSFDTKLKLWDFKKQKQIRSYTDHRGPINDLDITDDYISTASEDGDLRLWDLRSKSSIGKIKHGFNLLGCRFLNNKNLILSYGITDFLYLWDIRMNKEFLRKSKVLENFNDYLVSLCVSKISGFVYLLNSNYEINRIAGLLSMKNLPCFSPLKTDKRKRNLTEDRIKVNIDECDKFILNGDLNGKSFIRSLENGRILAQFKDHFTSVKEVLYNSTKKIFFSCGTDGLVIIRTI